MAGEADSPVGQAGRARRRREAALILPLLGAFLLLTPFVRVFAAPVTVLGLPLILIYLATVWAGLVLMTWALARRLRRGEEEEG